MMLVGKSVSRAGDASYYNASGLNGKAGNANDYDVSGLDRK